MTALVLHVVLHYLPQAKVVAEWWPRIPVLWALLMMTDGELPLSAARVGY